jgi:dihydroorotate dehydrogenase
MAKRDLTIEPPIMNAAGTLGFFPDLHGPIDWSQLGAFVTNPISLGRRAPAARERFTAFTGGFLLHTGYPNPGVNQALGHYAGHWSHAALPVIVHLLGVRLDEMVRMVRKLEAVEGITGLEVGIPSDASLEWVITLTQAAAGELPVIVRLPFERALELSVGAMRGGAMAVSVAPPRGMLSSRSGGWLQGRMYGPAVLPLALELVQGLVKLGIPTIGAGGVYRREEYDAMLGLGAMAVQLDGVLWRWAGHRIFQ